jgi:hypothetical protein
MRWQTTAVLALLLVLAGGYFFYDVRYLEPAREKREQAKDRLWALEPKGVEEVILEREAGRVRLKRSGDGWQIVEPVSAPGARGAIDDMVTTIATARMDREVADRPAALGDFGLEPPAAEVTLVVKDRPEPVRLALGSMSPTRAWVYAKKPDAPAVFLVSESLLRDATKPVSDYRDRTVLAFEAADVSRVELATRDDTIVLERVEPRTWRITKPVSLAADADAVRGFVDKLRSATVTDFVTDRPSSLAPFGLDRPARVQLTVGTEKDRTTRTLLFGRVEAGRKGIYVMRPGEPAVLLVGEDLWTAVPKTVAALRDKTVLAFDRDKLTRMELTSPKGTVALTKEKDRWRITAPESLPGDGAVISGLLYQVSEMKAQAFVPGARFRPEVTLSVWEDGAPSPKVLTLGRSAERRGGEPAAYASTASAGTVLVEARFLGELTKSASDLRDHMMFSELDHRAVKRVQVTSEGKSALFERTGETGWRMLEPTRGAARGSRVEDLVLTVAALRWNEKVGDGTELAQYGLDAPSLSVRLWNAEGAEMASVAVGKRRGTEAFVRPGTGPVYTVDTTRLGAPPKVPDDFKG